MRAEGKPNEGARFTIYIPLYDRTMQMRKGSSQSASAISQARSAGGMAHGQALCGIREKTLYKNAENRTCTPEGGRNVP